ncbi:hypothetical protein FACS189426_17270 [Bacteroidia bacterium]|nr:hypothetical protein FACS189426_17270 [Bacteroidia bacterium]
MNALFSLDSMKLCDGKPSLKITLDKTYLPKKLNNLKSKGHFYPKNVSEKLFHSEDDSIYFLNDANSLRFILSKNIILPSYKKGNRCKVSIKSSTKTVRNLKLQVTRFDKNENFIGIDSIYIENENENETWKGNELSFVLSNEKALEISIFYAGSGDSTQQIRLSSPVLWINNKDVGNLDTHSNQYLGHINTSLNPEYITPLSENDNRDILSNIDGIDDKLIIGLGECVHGSTNILRAEYQFAKNAIVDHNCKLVLWEYPIDMSLALELYVLGLVEESYGEEIKKDLRGTFGDYIASFEFIRWLRDYNSRTTEKVHFLGMDNPIAPKILLNDFISQLLNKERIHPYFKLIDSGDLDELADVLVLNDTIMKKTDNTTLKLFQKIIKTNLYSDHSPADIDRRDYEMYLRTCAIIDVLSDKNQKTVIIAHSVHLDRMQSAINRLFYNSVYKLGNYLATQYQNKYCTISFQVGKGLYVQDECSKLGSNRIEKLPEAITGSFEKSALNTNSDYFLYPSCKLNEHIVSKRYATRGERGNDQFQFVSIKKHFDAYVFIRENIPSQNIEQFPFFYMGKRLHDREKRYYFF